MHHPKDKKMTRRQFIKGAAAAVALPHVIPLDSLIGTPVVHAAAESDSEAESVSASAGL